MKQLPKKLSDRILVALTDLEACEKDPRYEIDMANYHYYDGKSKCHVCLAGVVMAKSFKINHRGFRDPYSFPGKVENQLHELNSIRSGTLGNLLWFNSEEKNLLNDMSYNNRKEWKLHMLDIVGRLKAEGL